MVEKLPRIPANKIVVYQDRYFLLTGVKIQTIF